MPQSRAGLYACTPTESQHQCVRARTHTSANRSCLCKSRCSKVFRVLSPAEFHPRGPPREASPVSCEGPTLCHPLTPLSSNLLFFPLQDKFKSPSLSIPPPCQKLLRGTPPLLFGVLPSEVFDLGVLTPRRDTPRWALIGSKTELRLMPCKYVVGSDGDREGEMCVCVVLLLCEVSWTSSPASSSSSA